MDPDTLDVEFVRPRLGEFVVRAHQGEVFEIVDDEAKPIAVLMSHADWQLLVAGAVDIRARAVDAHTRQADTGSGWGACKGST